LSAWRTCGCCFFNFVSSRWRTVVRLEIGFIFHKC